MHCWGPLYCKGRRDWRQFEAWQRVNLRNDHIYRSFKSNYGWYILSTTIVFPVFSDDLIFIVHQFFSEDIYNRVTDYITIHSTCSWNLFFSLSFSFTCSYKKKIERFGRIINLPFLWIARGFAESNCG